MALTQEDIAAIVEALKPSIVQIASEASAAHVTKRNKSFEDKMLAFEQDITSKFAPKPEQDTASEGRLTVKELEAKSNAEIQKLRNELKEERLSGQRKSMRSNLEASLSKLGIPSTHIKAVASQLIYEDKLVDISVDGIPTFKIDGDTVALDEGLSSWVKSDGKSFVPPPVAKGAGFSNIRAGSAPMPSNNLEEKSAALLELIRPR